MFIEEIAKYVPKALKISNIRKESFSINRHLQSLLMTRNDQLNVVGLRKNSWLSGLRSSFQPFSLYQYIHSNWQIIKKTRTSQPIIEYIDQLVQILTKAKDLDYAYYVVNAEDKKEINKMLKQYGKIKFIESPKSLVSIYLLGQNSFSIALI